MTEQKQFQDNQLVWVHSERNKGKIKGRTRSIPAKYLVEIITNFNKDTQERTTKMLTVDANDLDIYKEKKRQSKKYNPNEMYHMVKEFHKAFNHPVSNSPQHMNLDRAVSRAVWTGEEALVEFIHQSSSDEKEFLATYDKLIQGLEKAKVKSLTMDYNKTDEDKLIGQSDAIIDALYFLFGSLVEMGVKPFNLFKIVQDANMGKLHVDENGNKYAKYRDGDGKIVKPENWERDFAPEAKLKEEIKRQKKVK